LWRFASEYGDAAREVDAEGGALAFDEVLLRAAACLSETFAIA
jgi:hypothetical protein